MAHIDKIKDDKELDYLHPEGKPAVAAKTAEEKENKDKAKASTQLVKEIAESEKCDQEGGKSCSSDASKDGSKKEDK